VRDIEAGEMVVLDESGVHSLRPFPPAPSRPCIFEYIYFARPDSLMGGVSIYQARKKIGAVLADENGVDADVVIPVPDSGVPAAIGYSDQSGIPFELGIIRNHYVGRTFIEPGQQIRNLGVRLKHNANRQCIAGKKVILVDDSIVRGTTSIKIVEMVRAAGATEVHMRIAAPPTNNSCFYGIDTPKREELLASHMSIDEMRAYIGADSLAYISIEGLYRAVADAPRNDEAPQYCDACFTGEYPVPLVDQEGGPQAVQLSLLTETV
jgi:amidophosphoribosyltransferase